MWKLLWITTFVYPKSPAVTILKILFGNFQFLQLSITWNYSNSYVYGIYYISYLEWHASKFMRLSITAVVRVGTFQHYLLPTHVWCCRQTSCNQATIRPTIQPTIHFGNQPQNWNLRLPFDETQDFFIDRSAPFIHRTRLVLPKQQKSQSITHRGCRKTKKNNVLKVRCRVSIVVIRDTSNA